MNIIIFSAKTHILGNTIRYIQHIVPSLATSWHNNLKYLLVDPKVLLFWFGNFKKFVRISYILKLNKLFFNFQINYFPPNPPHLPGSSALYRTAELPRWRGGLSTIQRSWYVHAQFQPREICHLQLNSTLGFSCILNDVGNNLFIIRIKNWGKLTQISEKMRPHLANIGI
jgi:hypothetical protein